MSTSNWNKYYSVVDKSPSFEKSTVQQWKLNNKYRNACSAFQQNRAEKIFCKCKSLCESTVEQAKERTEETNTCLKQMLESIKFMKDELLQTRKDVVIEIDAFSAVSKRVNCALNAVKENAIKICNECLIARENRLGIDLVLDMVQKELQNECKIINGVQNLLIIVLQNSQEQLRRLKSILYDMDNGLKNKEKSLNIDEHNLQIIESSTFFSKNQETSVYNYMSIAMQKWEMQTQEMVMKCAKEINVAKSLRYTMNKILTQTTYDLNKQKKETNEALERQIKKTCDAKIKFENEHSEVICHVNEMNRTIVNLEKLIIEKGEALTLALVRFKNRSQKPDLELTEDIVKASLETEISELRRIISELQQKLFEAQACKRYLLKTQIQLEEEINIKANTLKIDEVDCMTLRQSLDYHAY